MTTLDADVIVVGAGPTGLLLAGGLAAAGVCAAPSWSGAGQRAGRGGLAAWWGPAVTR
jgi:ribulose 1,5-bisphosphate synthetase/thiazole synthase